jgi:hypothetical protein
MNPASGQLVTLEACALQIPLELHRNVHEPAYPIGSHPVAVVGGEELY